jgi:hypothetical protein
MSSIILDISQRDSLNVQDNGEYTTILSKPVEVFPGDTVQLKSVYLDTVSASDQVINLKQDVKINTTSGVYLLDWEDEKRTYRGSYIGSTNVPTGEMFIMMNKTQLIDATAIRFNKHKDTEGWGGFECTLELEKTDGSKLLVGPINVPGRAAEDNHWDFDIPGAPHTVINGTITFAAVPSPPPTFVESFDEMKEKYNTLIVGIMGTLQTPSEYVPHTSKYTFTLPKGVYQPDQLAQQISQVFSKNLDPFNKYWGINTPFMTVSTQHDYPQNMLGTQTEGPWFFHPTNHTKRFHLDPNADYIIGSNQMACEYDSVEQKFKLNINFPFYDSQGNISIWAARNNDNNFIKVNKHGGVWFNDLTTQYADGSSIDLFGDIMKFDMSKITVEIQDNFTTDGTVKYKILKTNLQDSVNVTGQYFGIDAFIDKSNPHFRDASSNPKPATATTIDYIFASEEFDDEEANSGYYLIEASGNFSSSFIQQNESRSFIRGIVSKYFSYKSYTSAGSQASIPYVHISKQPMLLSSVKVRILDPNTKKLPKNLGSDNTLFFEITRANPVQLTQEEQDELKKGKKKD